MLTAHPTQFYPGEVLGIINDLSHALEDEDTEVVNVYLQQLGKTPFLKKQIALVKPRIILLLGATALKHMIVGKKGFSMGEETGKFFDYAEYPGVKFMVLYHPAFLLRDPTKKIVMWEHAKKLRAFLVEHGWMA